MKTQYYTLPEKVCVRCGIYSLMVAKIEVFCSRAERRLFGASAVFGSGPPIIDIDVSQLHIDARHKLLAAIELIQDKQSKAVLLSGEPGAGKTHLLRWLANTSSSSGTNFEYHLNWPENRPATHKPTIVAIDSLEASGWSGAEVEARIIAMLEPSRGSILLILCARSEYLASIQSGLSAALPNYLAYPSPVKLTPVCNDEQVLALIYRRLSFLWRTNGIPADDMPDAETKVAPFVLSEVVQLEGQTISLILNLCDKARKRAQRTQTLPKLFGDGYILTKAKRNLGEGDRARERRDLDASPSEDKIDVDNFPPVPESAEGQDAASEQNFSGSFPAEVATIFPLRSLEIANFRGIREARVELHPHMTVFLGENAGGKTTVLDAAAVVLDEVVRHFRLKERQGDRRLRLHDIRRPLMTRKELREYRGQSSAYTSIRAESTKRLRWDVSRLATVGNTAALPSQWGLNALHQTLNGMIDPSEYTQPRKPSHVPLPLALFYGAERAIPQNQESLTKMPPEEFGWNDALSDALTSRTRFQDAFTWLRNEEDMQLRRRGPDPYLKLEWVKRALEKAIPKCKNPRVQFEPLRIDVDFYRTDEDLAQGVYEILSLQELSDGFRTHFSMVFDIARRMVELNPSTSLDDELRGTNSRAVVLIDEIDLHLHLIWQGTVLGGLRKAFPNTQFLVTTHSPQVIASVEIENVRKLTFDEGEVIFEDAPFAGGKTIEQIVVDVMGGTQTIEHTETSTALSDYTKLVNSGSGREAKALELRAQLDVSLKEDHRLRWLDMELRRHDRLAKQKK